MLAAGLVLAAPFGLAACAGGSESTQSTGTTSARANAP